jgi:Ca2+-binding RTX toxin-like protein
MSLLHWLRSLAQALSRKAPRPTRRPPRSAPLLEVLEDRTVPSWTASVNGGVLTFISSTAGDTLTLGVDGAGHVIAAQVGISPSITVASLTQLNVGGNPGVTGLTLDLRNLPYTGAANLAVNSLKVRCVPNASLTDSALTFAGGGQFTLSGVHLAELDAAGPNGNILDASGFSGVATLVGGPGNDTLLGGSGGAAFFPNGGSDVLNGAAGAANGIVVSGDFNYILHTGFLSYGTSAANFINVQQVDLIGGSNPSASDTFNLTGYTASALLAAGAGTNTLVYQADASMTLSNTALNVSNGASFALSGTFQNAQLTGGAGNDTLDASAFSGSTTLNSAGGNDVLKGGSGNDVFIVGTGSNTVAAGSGGFNTLSVDQAANMTLTNTSLTVNGVTSSISNIQTATLKAEPGGNWTLDASGFSGPVSLFGSTGNDVLKGGAGNDTINAGGGSDFIDGGGGVNTLVVARDANFTLSNSSLSLTSGSTTTTSQLNRIQNVFLSGGPGNNTFDVSGYTGSGSIFGNGGSDTVAASGAGTLSLTDNSLSRTGDGTLALTNIQNAVLTATSGGATFNVSSWSGTDTLNGKGNGDLFNVAFEGSGGATTVINDAGAGGNNRLVAAGANGNRVYGLSSSVAALGSGEAAYYSGLQNVTLYTLNGNDAVYIYGKAAGMTMTVNGGTGSDSFLVGSASNTLSTFDGTGGDLVLNGGTGSANALTVNDSGSTVNESFTVTAARMVRNTTGTPFNIDYTAPGAFGGNVVLLTGSGADSVTVNSDVAGGVTGINTGAGNDSVTVAPANAGPLSLAGLLYVDESAGSNALTVNDSAATTGSNLNVTGNSISDTAHGYLIDYVASNGGNYATGVVALLGSGSNTVRVFGTAPGALTAINGKGPDTFLVSSTAFTLDGFSGSLYLYGGSPSNYLVVSNAVSPAGDFFVVNDSKVPTNPNGTGLIDQGGIYDFGHSFGVFYSAVGTFGAGVFLYTGQGNDTVYVQGTMGGGTTSIASGAGNDQFYVGSPVVGLGNLLGPLSIDAGAGSNLLYVSDAVVTSGNDKALNVTANSITSSTPQQFGLPPLQLLYASTGGTFGQGVYVLGEVNSQITISSEAPLAPMFVSGGSGGQSTGQNIITLVVGPTSSYFGLTIDGGQGPVFNYLLLQAPGATTQEIPSGSRSGKVIVTTSGGVTSTVNFLDIDVLFRTA